MSALAWLTFCVAALLALRVPFTGDQYFFALGAEAIARGEALYVDFWDIKQPGIFYLYRVAALFPGDVALIVRSFEIAAWAVACGLAQRVLLCAGADERVVALTPATLGATYFLAAPAWHLSQVESFAVLPLMYCTLIATRPESRRVDWLLLGICTAFVVWLKLVLVLVPAALSVVMLWRSWQNKAAHSAKWSLLVDACLATCAFAAVLAILLVPFWSSEGLMALLDVTWTYSSHTLNEVPGAPLSRLYASLVWFCLTMAPIGLLACAIVRLRPVPTVVWTLLIGLATTMFCLGMQRFSWWAYHGTLLRPPLTLLALLAVGTESARLSSRTRLLVAGAVTLLALGTSLPGAAKKITVFPDSVLAATPSPRFESRTAPGYEQLRQQADWFVAQFGGRASLCVLGDTALAFHARAKCDMTLGTWSAPALSTTKWRQLATELRHARPDILYVAGSEADVLRVQQPEVLEWIEREYVLLRPGMPRDAWYMRRDLPARR